jgi:hypothetical protein
MGRAAAPGGGDAAVTHAILLRTHRFGAREASFAARLTSESGYEVAVLADERQGQVAVEGFRKLSFDRERLKSWRLYCPKDVAWRCGDYGFYLARAAMPEIDQFWMIEPDVRASVSTYAEVFASLNAVSCDFLAPGVMPADRTHFWQPTMRWMTQNVYHCHFAFCRLSAHAADICLKARQSMWRAPAARLMWPNDETFVTTTLVAQGRRVCDVRESGRMWWTDASFGFQSILRGEDFEVMPKTGLLYHPVLWGEDAERKARRHGRGIRSSEYVRLKLLRGLNRLASAKRAAA